MVRPFKTNQSSKVEDRFAKSVIVDIARHFVSVIVDQQMDGRLPARAAAHEIWWNATVALQVGQY